MRISTQQLFRSGTVGMQNLQTELLRTQNQMSTGRRILTPQDDPIGASEALKYRQLKEVNQQFIQNQAAATSDLSTVDSVLSGVGDELLSIITLAAQAGKEGLNPTDRGLILPELKERFNHLLELANSQDGEGLYYFGGFKSTTKPFEINTASTTPFSLSSPYVNYNGDSGVAELQVTPTQTVAKSTNGMNVFMQVRNESGNVIGRSIFDTVKNLMDMVDPLSGVAYTTAGYTQVMTDLKSNISHLGAQRASVGARLNSLENLTITGSDLSLQYDLRLSQLEDLDYTEAISRLSSVQMQFEAAQLSFKQISQMSLFSIL